eukprot:Skav235601  [mRNA]  locus=scaffold3336:56151:57140:+ [translate_table: standard]
MFHVKCCQELQMVFAIELLQYLAENNAKGFATVKDRASLEPASCVHEMYKQYVNQEQITETCQLFHAFPLFAICDDLCVQRPLAAATMAQVQRQDSLQPQLAKSQHRIGRLWRTCAVRCARAMQPCLTTSFGRRCFSVLKGSFPQTGASRDPSRPSVSKVMKEMLQNQTAAIPSGESTATPTKHIIESDTRTMPQHLPRSYLPASAGPAAADLGHRAGAAFRGLGQREQRFRAAPLPGAPSPQQSMWRPPGWNQPAEQKQGAPGAKQEYERPAIEVWGMRAVGLLVIFALYREFKDASISPTGQITRKPRPQIHLTQQEEEEQRRKGEN